MSSHQEAERSHSSSWDFETRSGSCFRLNVSSTDGGTPNPLVDMAIERTRAVLADFERDSLRERESKLLANGLEPEDVDSLMQMARARSARVCWSFLAQLRRELRTNY